MLSEKNVSNVCVKTVNSGMEAMIERKLKVTMEFFDFID